ncbi:Transposable element Tcb2 transposase [Anabarilius grahami]|uniref:Transposable element Tcb2 transposase n=1 Tax=Anabarilius grahami TaxID=495550 RepID=A0A3N0YGV3_ANAGA|nr:Transposable element Tcb2 transposase [Anabarilius grahami]
MVTCKETRAAIIALHKNGFTGKDIVATKIAPKSTIYRFIKNFKERGSILVKKASGRPRKSSKRQDRLLKRIQLRDRSATSAELAQEWQQAGVSASARTVRRRLLEDGLVSRRAAKKPLLSKKNIRDRLIFCRKYSEWTAEDWGKVIFSDEAPFRLFGASGKRLVRRRKVFGDEGDGVKRLSVMEGDSVTLDIDFREGFDLIKWRFGGSIIAETDGNEASYTEDERFRDRLKLNHQTGSLTFNNTRITDSGVYELYIDQNYGTLFKIFNVTVRVFGDDKDGVKRESVMEGDSVTLDTRLREKFNRIKWRFGGSGSIIAETDSNEISYPLNDTERFRDRLKLNNQTGSLIIKNMRVTDSGLYEIEMYHWKPYRKLEIVVCDPGLSPGVATGIVVVVLLLVLSAAAVLYYQHKISELERQNRESVADAEKQKNTDSRDYKLQIEPCSEDPGLSPGVATGIVVVVLLLVLSAAAVLYYQHKISELERQNRESVADAEKQKNTDSGDYKLQIEPCSEVFGADGDGDQVERASVMEGDSVTLNTDFREKFNHIKWRFGDSDSIIADTDINKISYTDDERFRDRLKLNNQTGSLTINNMRITDTGFYHLQIDHSTGTSNKTFIVTVYVFGDDKDGVKRVSVMEGDSVTLDTRLREKFNQIKWRFGDLGSIIAETDRNKISYTKDERFRDRLKLNNQTGSLTINNTRITDSGLYHLWIDHSAGTSTVTFIVVVYDPGLSPGVATGIVVVVLLLVLSAAAVLYYQHKISELERQNRSTGKNANESETSEIPLLSKEDPDRARVQPTT